LKIRVGFNDNELDQLEALQNTALILGEIALIDLLHEQKKIDDKEFIHRIKQVMRKK